MKAQTPRLFSHCALALSAALGFFAVTLARAEDKPDDQPTKDAAALDAAAAMHGDQKITGDVADKFTKFAGSPGNAEALVLGLRHGSEMTLLDAAGATTTFQPATEPMGFGNIVLTLSLARESLAKQGIKNPTPAQLQAALNGGSITIGTGEKAKTVDLTGVLALRANGQGWGQIAQQLDVKLGRVTKDLHAEATHIEKTMKPERLEPTGRPTGAEKPEAFARPEKPERPERFERPNRGPAGRE